MHETHPHSGIVPVSPLNAETALAVEAAGSLDDPAAVGLSTRPTFPGTSSNEEPATEGGTESSGAATETTPRRRARGPVARARLVVGRRLRDLPRPSAGANLRFKVAVVLSFVALVAALVANKLRKPEAPSHPTVAESEEPNPEAPALQIVATENGARRPNPPSPEAVEPDRPLASPPAPAVEVEPEESSTLASPASPLAEPPAPADPTLVTSALAETPPAEEEPAEPNAELPGLPDALNASPPAPAGPIDASALAQDGADPETAEPDPLAITPDVEGDDPAPSPLATDGPPASNPELEMPPTDLLNAPMTPVEQVPATTAAPTFPAIATGEPEPLPGTGGPTPPAATPGFSEPVESPVAPDTPFPETPADPLDTVPPATPHDASPLAPAPSVAIDPSTTPAVPVTPPGSGPATNGSNLSARVEPGRLQFAPVPDPSVEPQAPAPEVAPTAAPPGATGQVPATPPSERPSPTGPATEPVAPQAAGVEPDGEGTVVGARIEPITHVVRRNETFFTIARYYYGSGRYYRALWAANRDRVPRIDVLYVGTPLLVPAPEDLDQAYIDPPGSTAAASPSDRSSRSSGGAPGPDSARLAGRDEQAARTALESSTTPASKSRPVAERRGDVELDLPTAPASSGPEEARASNATAPADPATPRRYHARAYTVKREYETLRTIARDVLRDARRAREIFDLNADLLSYPDAYVPRGTRLNLPEPTASSR